MVIPFVTDLKGYIKTGSRFKKKSVIKIELKELILL